VDLPVDLPEHRDLEMKLSSKFVDIKRDIIHALRGEAH